METQEPRNLSQELNLIKDHDGLDGLPGYVVVVFKRLEHGGAKFVKIVNSNERFKGDFLPFFSPPGKYFGVAVNQSVLSFSFEVPVRLDDDLHQFTLISHLTFRASNPRLLAELSGQDPLRRLTDRIAMSIRRNWGSHNLERAIIDEERVRLTQTAADLGIEIVSLELERPDTPDATREGLNVAQEVGRSVGNVEKELVVCSVFAPRTARRGGSVLVQVFAHLEKDGALAKAMAAEFDEEAKRLASKRLDYEIERGTKLVFCISIPGLQVDEPNQELIWRGHPESVQFCVRVPKDFVDNEIIGTIYVSQNSIPFGHVKFLLRIETTEVTQEDQAPNTWKRYEYAFISYASQDRPEVLKRVQMLSRLHIEFFQDLLTLEPGERWEKGIYKGIDRSDVFFLFWSTAAKNSEWVMKEVRYALNRKGPDEFASPEIVPIIIEGPPLVPPPDELKHIHFNDRFVYFIK